MSLALRVVFGEESIDETIDLTGNVNIHMLVDMIDGTDLLERGFSNWCSAAVVFDPRGVTILASYVLMRQELETCMYYATREMSIAKKMLLMFDKNGNAKIRDDKLELV